MIYVYTHLNQNEDTGPEGSRYSTYEETLEYQGRKVLYHYVESFGVTFCTGSYVPHIGSVTVKGYVLRWKYGTNERGEALSEIEPITDGEEQQAISRLLWPGGSIPQVRFS